MSPKIVELEQISHRCDKLRAAGKRLVATNGCFDLLHAGHVRYLQAARALGDFLAIGLNGDNSVRELKGNGRPVTTESDRASETLDEEEHAVLKEIGAEIHLIPFEAGYSTSRLIEQICKARR